MKIRAYRDGDVETLAQLFQKTVHTVCAHNYSREQLEAWAPGNVDLEAWHASFLCHDTRVAVEGNMVLGFADMDETGYLDRLYVHRDFLRRGVATALCEALEADCPSLCFRTYASLTARPFFETRGYVVIRENQVVRFGVELPNFLMEKWLDPPLSAQNGSVLKICCNG